MMTARPGRERRLALLARESEKSQFVGEIGSISPRSMGFTEER